MRRSLKFIARLALAMAVLVAASVAAVHVWQAWRLLRAEEAFEEMGFPVDDPESAFAAAYPAIPEDENGALLFMDAEELLRDGEVLAEFPTLYSDVKWRKPAHLREWAKLARPFVAAYEEALARAVEAAEKPAYSYPVEWAPNPRASNPREDVRPFLLPLLLRSAMVCAAVDGNNDAYLDAFRARMAFLRSMAEVPLIDWQMYRVDQQGQCFRDARGALAWIAFDDPELAAIAGELDRAPAVADAWPAIALAAARPREHPAVARDPVFKRKRQMDEWKEVAKDVAQRAERWPYVSRLPLDLPRVSARVLPSLYRVTNLADAGRAAKLEAIQRYIAILRAPNETNASPQDVWVRMQTTRTKLNNGVRSDFAYAHRYIERPQRAVEALVGFYGATNYLETAVALERYRVEYGRYPETLDALVPSYLPALPEALQELWAYTSHGHYYQMPSKGRPPNESTRFPPKNTQRQ